MARETTFEPGAITAGTPIARSFRTLAHSLGVPEHKAFRDNIKIDNSRGTSTLIIVLNGDTTRRLGPGAVGTLDPGTPVYFYTIDAEANVATGLVIVYENGGLDEVGEDKPTRFDR